MRTITDPRPDTTADTTADTPRTADDWRAAGQRLLKAGATLEAYDTLVVGLRAWPGDLRMRQLLALALARSGASREANALLAALVSEGHGDEETLGLLARTHKDLWAAATTADAREAHLAAAARTYTQAYRQTGGYWTGINAATLALVKGDLDGARILAGEVEAQCRALVDDGQEDYWLFATLGEAALVCGDLDGASAWYRRAVALQPDHIGDIASTRRNARLVARASGLPAGSLDAWLPVPHVVVFAGHLIDRADRAEPRFPAWLESAVREELRRRLADIGPAIGYAAAACGGDLILLELLADAGAETRVVLPYGRDTFVEDSVAYAGRGWVERFDRALARASQVTIASDHRLGSGSASFEYGFRVLDGTAALAADQLDTDLVCLALWDGRPGDGPGGTAGSVEHWRRAGRRLEIVDITTLRTRHAGPHTAPTDRAATSARPATGAAPAAANPAPPHGAAPPTTPMAGGIAPAPAFDPQIVGLLFADAHGFSKLTEQELPIFVEQYLGLIARELAAMPSAPLLTNTWGDGLYAVFRDVADTGVFALRLCEAVRRTDWTALGIAAGLSLRIGLHAGPAYACTDPVTGRLNFIGAHVSRAARIEPIAPAGEVYASGAFAALARADEVRSFSCTYVGQTPLAKGYGTFPTYVVRQR